MFILPAFFVRVFPQGVGITFLNRAWVAGSGLITAALITTQFSADVQGFAYTCLGLIAFQTIFELGFSQVITQFISHEATLAVDPNRSPQFINQARSRLRGLFNLCVRWNVSVGICFFLVLGVSGQWLLNKHTAPEPILIAWWIMTGATSIGFLNQSWRSLLDGCDRIATTQAISLRSSFFATLLGWIIILNGGEMYGLVAMSLGNVCLQGVQLWRTSSLVHQSWDQANPIACPMHREIWSQQWRFALSWIGGVLGQSTFVPLTFYYLGPSTAGQAGLSMQLFAAMGLVSTVWLYPQSPRFGQLAAQGDEKQFRQLVRRGLWVSATLALICGVGMLFFLYILMQARDFNRTLPLTETSWLLAAAFVNQVTTPLIVATRFLKEEPFVIASLGGGILLFAGHGWCLSHHQMSAACLLYFLITFGVILPLVLFSYQKTITRYFVNATSG